MYTIYGLTGKDDNIRYVGVSTKDERFTINHHRSNARHAKSRRPVNEWILEVGKDLGYKEIMTGVTAEQKDDRLQAIIVALKDSGADLLNVAKPKVEKPPKVKLPRVITAEQREIISRTHKGKKLSVETKAKISEKAQGHKRNAGRKHSPEAREKMSKSHHANLHVAKGVVREGCRWC